MQLSLTLILEKLNVTEENKKNGRMIAIKIPREIAGHIMGAADDSHNEDIDEDEVQSNDMHITLALIEDETEPQKIVKVLKSLKLKPFKVAIRGMDIFEPNGHNEHHVLYAKVVPSLVSKLQKILLRKLNKYGVNAPDKWKVFGGYKPHVTIKYSENPIAITNKNGPKLDFVCNKLYFFDRNSKYSVRLS